MDQAAQLRKMKVKAEMTGVAPSEYKAVEKQRNSGIRVLAVTSGKGGVGKTHVSANLAYSLARLGKRVLVFDAD
ncbi:MAG TPA: AAA family ATPase, partial [Syntrophales bacterium]|nr:AAA family ATPase [Syntrophales bacterium]